VLEWTVVLVRKVDGAGEAMDEVDRQKAARRAAEEISQYSILTPLTLMNIYSTLCK